MAENRERVNLRIYKTEISSASIHKQLINRKRQFGESVRCYIYSMQEIINTHGNIYIGNIDTDSLIEYIIRRDEYPMKTRIKRLCTVRIQMLQQNAFLKNLTN